MRLILFSLVLLFSLNGCSSGSNTVNAEENLSNEYNTSEYALFEEQWSINYDSEFYTLNTIDENANINAFSILNSYSGKGVKVAIIDDGFDVNHLSIKDNIIKTISVDINSNVTNNASHYIASDYHGTAVAGIIASSDKLGVRGIAPAVELILIRMPQGDFLSDESIIEMFKQARDAGADVINCSWGTGDVSDVVRDYIDEITKDTNLRRGTIVVFAAGNDDQHMGNDESSIEGVIAVGATDSDNLRTSYSNYGEKLDIVAPGGFLHGISTIDPTGEDGVTSDDYNRYNELSNGEEVSFIGTSASAPIITATIALALEKDPSQTKIEIEELLKISTSTIGNNTPYIYDVVTSSSTTPTITGIYGATQNESINIKLFSKENSNLEYGPFSVNSTGNNEWSSTVTDSLVEGNYTVKVMSNSNVTTWATDENLEVSQDKSTFTDKSKLKSDFYGYGKIDVQKLMDNI